MCLDWGLLILMVFNIVGVMLLVLELWRWCIFSFCGYLCCDLVMIYLWSRLLFLVYFFGKLFFVYLYIIFVLMIFMVFWWGFLVVESIYVLVELFWVWSRGVKMWYVYVFGVGLVRNVSIFEYVWCVYIILILLLIEFWLVML